MAINCYCGLMGSGKTFEVVSNVIVPAIRKGRRVVTNIDGIDNDMIRAYCAEKFDIHIQELGSVINVNNQHVTSQSFFPLDHNDEKHISQSFVQPGDLVCIDEAYKIWGQDCKILPAHVIFFREHRHYINPQSGIACDLVLMTQAITDLHRILKVVIEQSFRCHKAKGIGKDNLYTVTMWEGWKQTQKTIVKDWTKTYDPQIFALYKSYSGSGQGKEIAADQRQNIFSDKRYLYKLAFFVFGGGWAVWHLITFFSDKISKKPAQSTSPIATQFNEKNTSKSDISTQWRIAGTMTVGGVEQIVLVGQSGVRAESAISYTGAGLSLSGKVDGSVVNRFSGPVAIATPSKKDGMLP